ncbi:MAG: polyphosphate kinase 1 [Mariniblastus sp.]|nr:polyphosphate kinase 1 [Mariniblastus sp.]
MSIEHEYINRELSWLEFNQRVLDQAECQDNPLLERVKFLAITSSNLNEFFMVRVGGLKILSESNSSRLDIAGFTPNQQLERIRHRVRRMYLEQSDCLLNQLEPELESHGIRRMQADALSASQIEHLRHVFREQIEPVIAPIAVHRDRNFPLLVGAGVCLGVRLANEAAHNLGAVSLDGDLQDRFAVIPLGRSLSRFIYLPDETGVTYMLLEDVVTLFLEEIFGPQAVLDSTPFRITRNADITASEDVADDQVLEMKQLLAKRNVSDCVRLEISENASQPTLEFLKAVLNVSDDDLYPAVGPLDLSGYFTLASLPGFQELKDEPWPSQQSPDFPTGGDPFEIIAEADRLLVHPYQSYDPVVEFLTAAASDPQVIAIKQTLYRTARESKIVSALARAAENGKHVTAIIELKARFDEAQNIRRAELLEQAGVDVIYGVQGLKTHAKICIVVRREERGIQRYIHFGTGNYNETTARIYSDVSYFTNNPELGDDAVHFFNAITGLSVPQQLNALSAAPIDCREKLTELIHAESQNARKGGGGAITAKMNSLVDRKIIDALYEASQAGVKIRLNVRGICCLKPGIPGLSENIRVVSIVDRFLEHARIFHFHHDGDNQVFISSADWMNRNLDRRVELMIPVVDAECRKRLIHTLETYFHDNVKALQLDADGAYHPVQSGPQQAPFRSQYALYQEASDMFTAYTNPKATVFKAHRGETA